MLNDLYICHKHPDKEKKMFKKGLEFILYSHQIKTVAFQMVTSSNLQISHHHFVHL